MLMFTATARRSHPELFICCFYYFVFLCFCLLLFFCWHPVVQWPDIRHTTMLARFRRSHPEFFISCFYFLFLFCVSVDYHFIVGVLLSTSMDAGLGPDAHGDISNDGRPTRSRKQTFLAASAFRASPALLASWQPWPSSLWFISYFISFFVFIFYFLSQAIHF